MDMRTPATGLDTVSRCPFLAKGGYETLGELTHMAQEMGITEAVRHLSHEECNYPGSEKSARFTALLRKEITNTFQGFDEFVDGWLEENNLDDCIDEYTKRELMYDLDMSRFTIPERKSVESILAQLHIGWKDDKFIGLLMRQVSDTQDKYDLSLKDATMKVMRQWQGLIRPNEQSESLMGSLIGAIDEQRREGLLLFADLQDKIFSHQQINAWNHAVEEDKRYGDAIKTLHFLLVEYVKTFCEHHPERFDHSFYPLQEICTYTDGEIVPHDRFLKIIASNIGPLLMEEVEGGDIHMLGKKIKDAKLFEQYIFGFTRDAEGVKINEIEPKSCPAKRMLIPAATKVLPLLFAEK